MGVKISELQEQSFPTLNDQVPLISNSMTMWASVQALLGLTDWSSINNKPATYPPEAHGHNKFYWFAADDQSHTFVLPNRQMVFTMRGKANSTHAIWVWLPGVWSMVAEYTVILDKVDITLPYRESGIPDIDYSYDSVEDESTFTIPSWWFSSTTTTQVGVVFFELSV